MKRKIENLLFSLGAGIVVIVTFVPLCVYFWFEKKKIEEREEKYKGMKTAR